MNNKLKTTFAGLALAVGGVFTGVTIEGLNDPEIVVDREDLQRVLRDDAEARRAAAQDAGDEVTRQGWLVERRLMDLAVSLREYRKLAEAETKDIRQHLDRGVVPAGVYRVDEPIEVTESVVFEPGAVLVWSVDTGPALVVNTPDVTLAWHEGSLVIADGWLDLEATAKPYGITPIFAQSAVAVLADGHRCVIDGLTVRSTGDYCSAVYVVNARDGVIRNLDIERYCLGIRLTNPGIKGWALDNIKGDWASQSYNVHGGPGHLIYSLTADNLTIRDVYEGPHCFDNRVGQIASYGGVIEPGKTGHSIKVSHASDEHVTGLTIERLHSRNRSGPLILGGAIDGAVVRGEWSIEGEPLTAPYSPVLKLNESNKAKLTPVNLDVKIKGISHGE